MLLGKHAAEDFAGLLFNGEGVGGDTVLQAGIDGFFDVVNALVAFVTIVITRAAIDCKDDELAAGGLRQEEFLRGVTG